MNKKTNAINIFLKFLKDNDLYTKYINNVTNENYFRNQPREHYSSPLQFLKNAQPYNYFYDAFTWSYTSEGSGFWRDACDEWVKVVRKQKFY